jgi:hypothetical protein
MSTAKTIFEDIERQAGAIIAKAAIPLSKADAYARLFKEHPELYRAYVEAQQAEHEQRWRWSERHGAALSGLLLKVAKGAGDGDVTAGLQEIKKHAPALLELYQAYSGVPVL